MLYPLRAKLALFKQLRISRTAIKSFHKRIFFLLLVLFFLCSMLLSQSILWPLTHRPRNYEQGNDQIPFEGDISSSDFTLTWPERAENVKAAFIHAYVGYKTYAFGMDELKSVSNGGVNNLNGWGLTIIDSLDTMLLMDLRPHFVHAIHEHVVALKFTDRLGRVDNYVPFFETQIRYFGGLLSAHHLASISPYKEVRETASILRTKAEELGEAMLPAFNTESGLPAESVDTSSGRAGRQASPKTNLAEIASNQVEYKYLSHLIASSGRPIGEAKSYFTKPDHVMDILERWQGKNMTWGASPPVAAKPGSAIESEVATEANDEDEVMFATGLWKTSWRTDPGEMYGGRHDLWKRLANALTRPPEPNVVRVSIGALGDSAYEYLLKQYLLSGRTETRLLDMYLKAVDGVINHLLYLSVTRDLLYVTDTVSLQMRPTGRMEHLSCFLPGTLALGAKLLDPDYAWPHTSPRQRSKPSDTKRAPIPKVAPWSGDLKRTLDLHMRVARGLATTCYVLYADTPTGVGPEDVYFNAPRNADQSPNSQVKNFTKARWRERLIEWEDGGRRGPLIGTDRWGPEVEEKVVLRGMGKDMGIGGNREQDYRIRGSAGYLLRPEAIEAMYILWRTTGDDIWRRRGWEMFEAVETWTRTDSGYASLVSVLATEDLKRSDKGMASYFLAETLKYSYLLCLDKDPVPLDRFVFNTEAHPLPMFTWSENEMKEFGIRG